MQQQVNIPGYLQDSTVLVIQCVAKSTKEINLFNLLLTFSLSLFLFFPKPSIKDRSRILQMGL